MGGGFREGFIFPHSPGLSLIIHPMITVEEGEVKRGEQRGRS